MTAICIVSTNAENLARTEKSGGRTLQKPDEIGYVVEVSS
jgi:hypothetical protein